MGASPVCDLRQEGRREGEWREEADNEGHGKTPFCSLLAPPVISPSLGHPSVRPTQFCWSWTGFTRKITEKSGFPRGARELFTMKFGQSKDPYQDPEEKIGFTHSFRACNFANVLKMY